MLQTDYQNQTDAGFLRIIAILIMSFKNKSHTQNSLIKIPKTGLLKDYDHDMEDISQTQYTLLMETIFCKKSCIFYAFFGHYY